MLLVGGENTELNETSFDGATPKKHITQTPNVVLGTPFRTPGQSGLGATPGRIMTPQLTASGSMTPAGRLMTPAGQTPVRDQLQINQDDAMSESFGSVRSMKQQSYDMKAQLRAGLSNLPAPKNDFEIVAPEEMEVDGEELGAEFVVDAAELDERKARAQRDKGRCDVMYC